MKLGQERHLQLEPPLGEEGSVALEVARTAYRVAYARLREDRGQEA